ncbi:ATP-dependent DNA helicase PIF1 [Colletotrichum karsti]|uniref:ATP-dependent DNA helicase n=1 Tax=Colletotrichum karsti TaxID=1095194 RepID=A0A9P6LNW2_9PEZI|nr:ATP-dependent DNA helicase PIF1 [Colletotrichum karsti]KAF9879661.1 ATP-dependent DNA helicase PIF1 [Colletotrichum karsti]
MPSKRNRPGPYDRPSYGYGSSSKRPRNSWSSSGSSHRHRYNMSHTETASAERAIDPKVKALVQIYMRGIPSGLPKYYAVWGGDHPGMYTDWDVCRPLVPLVQGTNAKGSHMWHKMFKSYDQALKSLESGLSASNRLEEYLAAAGLSPATSVVPSTAIADHADDETHPNDASDVQVSDDDEVEVIDLTGDASDAEEQELAGQQPTEEPLPPLCEEQQKALDLAVTGHNLFITGSGGCGKSVLVKTIHRTLQAANKEVHLIAPTGIAAVNIGGYTTFSYMGWTPEDLKKTNNMLLQGASRKRVYDRLRQTQVLIIDEISLVDSQFFDRVNYVLTAVRQDAARRGYNGLTMAEAAGPFGGVQIIAVGDMCQLVPWEVFRFCTAEVKDWEGKPAPCGKMAQKTIKGNIFHYCPRDTSHDVFHHRSKWVFKSSSWRECNFRYVHLTQIHRQQDEEFVRILQRCRLGHVDERDLDILMADRKVEDGIRLIGRNDAVADHNTQMFSQLPGKPVWFWCFDYPQMSDADDKKQRYADRVDLKLNMPVVLLANIDIENGLCNGSQGTIRSFVTSDKVTLPDGPSRNSYGDDEEGFLVAKARCQHVRSFVEQNRGALFPEVEFNNGERRVIGPDCTISEIEKVLDENTGRWSLRYKSRTQIPLVAGWAITIHKSQSMSLERLIVDLASAWDGRQIYVALSRARSLEGLKIAGGFRARQVMRTKLQLDPDVLAFEEEIAEKTQQAEDG